MNHIIKHAGDEEWVSASEVASYVYCPEQWRLQSALGLNSSNAVLIEHGTRMHKSMEHTERIASRNIRRGYAIVVAGVILIMGLLFRLIWE